MGPDFVIDLWPFCRGFMVGLSWMHGDFVLNLCWALCWVLCWVYVSSRFGLGSI